MKITFWGAAQTVTGSMHHLEIAGKRYLLDCGLYQGHRKDAEHRNRDLPFDARSIDSVVLSHAHIDHSGNLPTLVKHGFDGPIYTTPPTIDLCGSMLRDTAHIQESDVKFVNKRGVQRHPKGYQPVEPLYTMQDAEKTLPLLSPVNYHTVKQVGEAFSYQAYDAGILGAGFGNRRKPPDLFRRRRAGQSSDHPRSREHAGGRLSHYGEHLRRSYS
jgi:metallo-beta-lactamase family protein